MTKYILNQSQRKTVNEAIKWYKNSSEQVFQLAGDAGTGKSVVLNCLVEELGIDRNKIAPMAHIGAAVIVMRLKGFWNARTIYSWMFTPVKSIIRDNQNIVKYNDYFNRPIMDIEFEPKTIGDIELIIIDEGGSVPYNLKNQIESHGIKIIVAGDLDQLPPVGDKPAYLYDGKVHILDELMRQSKYSAIIYLAQRAKLGLPIHEGFYGDVLVINEDDLTDMMILNSDIILCGKNNTRDFFNKRIRSELLHIHSDIPIYNEKIICRKNNWNIESDGINLANGLVGRVINNPDVSRFDGKTFHIDFLPDLSNSPFIDISCDYDYFTAPYEMKQSIKNNKYNMGEKFEFAYCSTTHLAQGSQYANGIYFQEYLNKDVNNKLDYTGITRFSNSLIIVKKKRKYY